MTIKFEPHGFRYKIYDSEDKHFQYVISTKDDFEQLFKDMAKELGYAFYGYSLIACLRDDKEKAFKELANELGYHINKCKPGICCYPCCNQSILLDSQYCKEHMYNDEEYSRRYIKPKSESNNICEYNDCKNEKTDDLKYCGWHIAGIFNDYTKSVWDKRNIKSESEHKIELRLENMDNRLSNNDFDILNRIKDLKERVESKNEVIRELDKRLKDVEDYIKMSLDEDDFWDE